MESISFNLAQHSDITLPFIIGLSGHRDIKAMKTSPELGLEGVKIAVKRCLSMWKERVGEDTPIWLMTGLASGSDMLAVEAAEELILEGWSASHLRITPVLPMAYNYYKLDFELCEMLKLEELLTRYKENIIEIRSELPRDRVQSAYRDTSYGNDRNSLYQSQGAFLARYCNVLISIWDGYDSNNKGGTADAVKFKLGFDVKWSIEKEYVQSCFKQPEGFERHFSGVVQHLPVLRDEQLTSLPLNGEMLEFLDELKDKKSYPCYISSTTQKETHSVIQEVQSKELLTLIKQLKGYNNSIEKHSNKIQSDSNHCGLNISKSAYSVADSLALYYQREYRKRMIIFFIASLIALAMYEVVGMYIGKSVGVTLNIVILILIFLCWSLIKMARKHQWKWKYQVLRGVAEVMRIRGYLNIANIKPDQYSLLLSRYKIKLPIFYNAILLAELDWWMAPIETRYDIVKRDWLQSQKLFLSSRLQMNFSWKVSTLLFKKPKLAKKCTEFLSNNLLVIAFFMGGLLFMLQLFSDVGASFFNVRWVEGFFVIMIQYSIMSAGVVALWAELAGYKSTVTGYEELISFYDVALNTIETSEKELVDTILQSLAREAMLEHCEWSYSESKIDISSKI